MLSCKFKLLALLLVAPNMIFAGFSDMECLNGAFSSKVSHKVLWKLNRTLSLEKNGCLMIIDYKKYNQYLGSRWQVDVCRAPIHIKKGSDSIEVIKKDATCQGAQKKNIFCHEFQELSRIIQDDGLIFAEGEKEDLSSDHGRVHCSHLLLKAYLDRDIVFNRQKEYQNILQGNSKPIKESFSPAQNVQSVPISKEAPFSTDEGADF